MKYFFILGNHPALSIAEILNVWKNNQTGFSYLEKNNCLLLEVENSFSAGELMARLGGTIKIGLIADESSRDRNELLKKIKPLLNPSEGKFKFGLSYYGQEKLNTRALGMEIKKYLREKNISCRWVISREPVLSSVVVEQNKLATKGAEMVLLEQGKQILIGQTLAVQPFKALSFRDYGRPGRDDESGMLPPKLAQIMINLAQTNFNDILLDPFCGSGTILTEAMLMGYKNLIGTDLSEKAIADTEKNIAWIADNFEIKSCQTRLEKISATKLSELFKPISIDTIITEPYLGPQRGAINEKKVISELENLYSQALAEFKKILKKNKIIIMLFPVLFKKHYLNPDLKNWERINPLPPALMKNTKLSLSPRGNLLYGRVGQKVWREIMILKNI